MVPPPRGSRRCGAGPWRPPRLGCSSDSSERRPGGDLPAHRLEPHRPAVPGLCRRQPASAAIAIEQLDDLVIEDDASGIGSAAAVQVAGLGYGDCPAGIGGRRHGGPTAGRRRAMRWLLDRQIRRPGDWAETVDAEPGGWCFEYHNEFYPDCDDTAMVLMALRSSSPQAAIRHPDPGPPRCRHPGRAAPRARLAEHMPDRPLGAAIDRGLRWMLAMQNDDGGWGAFDRNNDRQFLCYIPFADHNAMIDPSTPDLAGRVLEALGHLGRRVGDPVGRSRGGLSAPQRRRPTEAGLAAGASTTFTAPGRRWPGWPRSACRATTRDGRPAPIGSLAHQQPCGGWGESADSYDRSQPPRPGTADRLADGLGRDGPAGRRTRTAPGRGPRHPLSRRPPAGRRHLGRSRIHRHRLPPSVLSPLPLLSDLLSAHGPIALRGHGLDIAGPDGAAVTRVVAADEEEPPLREAAGGQ